MKSILAQDVAAPVFYSYLNATVSPRPIAFASTVSAAGQVNLSPFSFFNVMGIDPPILVFAPNKRGRDGSLKDTSRNLREVPEVVINLVHYDMVQQMSLASSEYAHGVDEFDKAGFTPLPSTIVKPPRVQESLVHFECKLLEIKEIGSMDMMICEVLLAHFDEKILDQNGRIDQLKTDFVARLGANWYSRANAPTLFEVPRPQRLALGIDQLPAAVRDSKILTGNDLGMLANIEALPSIEAVKVYHQRPEVQEMFEQAMLGCVYLDDLLHLHAKNLLVQNNVPEAWLTLLQSQLFQTTT
jgi:flavin reductase (DIM6/NTAB) family NADH-FMN oxidoreductase RutF